MCLTSPALLADAGGESRFGAKLGVFVSLRKLSPGSVLLLMIAALLYADTLRMAAFIDATSPPSPHPPPPRLHAPEPQLWVFAGDGRLFGIGAGDLEGNGHGRFP